MVVNVVQSMRIETATSISLLEKSSTWNDDYYTLDGTFAHQRPIIDGIRSDLWRPITGKEGGNDELRQSSRQDYTAESGGDPLQ